MNPTTEPPDNQMPKRKGMMGASTWTPYGKGFDANGSPVVLARNEHGYPSEFTISEWQMMCPLQQNEPHH
jgi:hypothetical protein